MMSGANAGSAAYEEIEIVSAQSPAFDAFYAIYEEALPAGERKSRGALAALVARRDYSVLALVAEGTVRAFAIVFLSATADVGLLEYMATEKGWRNARLGERLFHAARARMGDRVMLVEVDSEREDAKDRDIRVRRKDFYLRLGCKQIAGVDYVMPMVSSERPPVMDLLYHDGGRGVSVTKDLLRTWLTTIYIEVYDRSGDDPAIEAMVSGLATP